MNARRQFQTLSRTQRAIGALAATVVALVLFNGVVSLGTINQDAGIHLAQATHVAQAEPRTSNQ